MSNPNPSSDNENISHHCNDINMNLHIINKTYNSHNDMICQNAVLIDTHPVAHSLNSDSLNITSNSITIRNDILTILNDSSHIPDTDDTNTNDTDIVDTNTNDTNDINNTDIVDTDVIDEDFLNIQSEDFVSNRGNFLNICGSEIGNINLGNDKVRENHPVMEMLSKVPGNALYYTIGSSLGRKALFTSALYLAGGTIISTIGLPSVIALGALTFII